MNSRPPNLLLGQGNIKEMVCVGDGSLYHPQLIQLELIQRSPKLGMADVQLYEAFPRIPTFAVKVPGKIPPAYAEQNSAHRKRPHGSGFAGFDDCWRGKPTEIFWCDAFVRENALVRAGIRIWAIRAR